MLQQHRPRYDVILGVDQTLENLKFPRPQVDVATAPGRSSRHQVKLEPADAQNRFPHCGAAAAPKAQ